MKHYEHPKTSEISPALFHPTYPCTPSYALLPAEGVQPEAVMPGDHVQHCTHTVCDLALHSNTLKYNLSYRGISFGGHVWVTILRWTVTSRNLLLILILILYSAVQLYLSIDNAAPMDSTGQIDNAVPIDSTVQLYLSIIRHLWTVRDKFDNAVPIDTMGHTDRIKYVLLVRYLYIFMVQNVYYNNISTLTV